MIKMMYLKSYTRNRQLKDTTQTIPESFVPIESEIFEEIIKL
jgi:hypothetical protein